MTRRTTRLGILICCAGSLLAQNSLSSIAVTGNQRLPAAAIAQASGLRLRQAVTTADLEKANQTLFDTGLFTAVSYRYEAEAGANADWGVTFAVTEDRVPVEVRIDIPGTDEKQLWEDLKRFDGLLDRHIPASEQAVQYYKRAMEAYLEKSGEPRHLIATNVGDLRTKKMEVDFSVADPTKITAIHFSGNHVVNNSALQGATAKLVVGQNFGERRLREIVDLNVKPLYLAAAYLTPVFSVKLDGTVVEVQVEDGPRWLLGKVTLTGDNVPLKKLKSLADFPEGRAAHWDVVSHSIYLMEHSLRLSGYSNVSTNMVTQLHEADHVVDLQVEFHATPPKTGK